ncbi:ribonuclease HI [Persephonella sp.]
MKKVQIYTDGSSLGNPGPGGWCAVLRYNRHQKILKGGKKHTTNNEMEIRAVLEGLKALKEPCQVELYTDSKYVADALTDWIYRWEKNNWKNSSKKEVSHKEMWQELLKLLRTHNVSVNWVKAHSGHPENELCDKIAKEEARKYSS